LNSYVRHFEQRADRPSDDRYGRSIRVKPNVAEVLRRELARASWRHEEVALGTATDPYQPAEARFRLTRSCIRELAASVTPLSIVTRGPLIVRDIDVLQAAARKVPVGVSVSLPTLDERAWRTTRPGTGTACEPSASDPCPGGCGIEVGVGRAPIVPGLSDRPEQLEAVVTAARAAGARGIWAGVVHLRPGVREHFLEALARDWPEQVEHYEELFGTRAYLPAGIASAITDPARRAKASTRFSSSRQPVRAQPRQLALAL
jgi:DNA repair photolyase